MNIILSKRLQAIAGMVPTGSVPADIGTDHGYIPIFLVQKGTVSHALAMDVRPGPLERAREHIESCGLSEKITVRLSDGLDHLDPGEADTLIIAGMGGALIERILSLGKENGKLEGIRCIILGAQSELPRVRSWILANGFSFDDEEMVEEDGKYYPIIRAVPDGGSVSDGGPVSKSGCEAAGDSEPGEDCGSGAARGSGKDCGSDAVRGSGKDCGSDAVRGSGRDCGSDAVRDSGKDCSFGKGQILREVLLEYGPVLLKKRHPVLREYLLREERLCGKIRDQILANGTSDSNASRLEEISARLERIRVAKDMIERAQ